MRPHIKLRLVSVALVLSLVVSAAVAYIHFPPMTLQKMCKTSTHIRVLSIKKFDKDKGTIEFEMVDMLKGTNANLKSFRHAVRTETAGVKPILDWAKDGKQAVMFTIGSGAPGTTLSCGYVFIDDFCYSVDYNRSSDYWLVMRAEPNMSACYHGSAEQLRKLTKDILDGKEVKVPVKEPAKPVTKEENDKRVQEVTDIIKKNRR